MAHATKLQLAPISVPFPPKHAPKAKLKKSSLFYKRQKLQQLIIGNLPNAYTSGLRGS